MVIIINVLGLSLFDYSDRDSMTVWNKVIDKVDTALTYIFICEAILKIIGMGFIIHKSSYLRQGWNIIDFLIVITG